MTWPFWRDSLGISSCGQSTQWGQQGKPDATVAAGCQAHHPGQPGAPNSSKLNQHPINSLPKWTPHVKWLVLVAALSRQCSTRPNPNCWCTGWEAGDIKMPFSHHCGVGWQTFTQIYVPSHAHPAACPQAGAIPPCPLDTHTAQPRSLALPEHTSRSSKDKHAEIFKQSDSCLI